jgi:hypothetical protein
MAAVFAQQPGWPTTMQTGFASPGGYGSGLVSYAAPASQPAMAAARAPMGFVTTAPQGKDYGYWHERGAAFQMQQPGAIGQSQALSPQAKRIIMDTFSFMAESVH